MKKLYKIILLLTILIFLTTYSPNEITFLDKNNNFFFKIQNIEITNNNKINKTDIKNKLNHIYNKNILFISNSDIANPLKTVDYLQKVEVKKKSDNDDLAIYRLYNQTTPLEVRSLLCPTLSDWQDLNGQYKNIAHEYTIVENLDIKAHLKTYRSKRTQIVTLMANPEYNYNILKHLLQFSLTVLNEIDGVKVFIPDFQVSAHTAALEIDLCKSTSYDIYVLPITATQKLAAEETAVGFVT